MISVFFEILKCWKFQEFSEFKATICLVGQIRQYTWGGQVSCSRSRASLLTKIGLKEVRFRTVVIFSRVILVLKENGAFWCWIFSKVQAFHCPFNLLRNRLIYDNITQMFWSRYPRSSLQTIYYLYSLQCGVEDKRFFQLAIPVHESGPVYPAS